MKITRYPCDDEGTQNGRETQLSLSRDPAMVNGGSSWAAISSGSEIVVLFDVHYAKTKRAPGGAGIRTEVILTFDEVRAAYAMMESRPQDEPKAQIIAKTGSGKLLPVMPTPPHVARRGVS